MFGTLVRDGRPETGSPDVARYDSALRTTMLISQDVHCVERDPRGAQRRL
jgi:hypothetical protein